MQICKYFKEQSIFWLVSRYHNEAEDSLSLSSGQGPEEIGKEVNGAKLMHLSSLSLLALAVARWATGGI